MQPSAWPSARVTTFSAAFALALIAASCGGEPARPDIPASPSSAEPEASAAPEPAPEASATPSAEPTATAKAKTESSGRPAVMTKDATEISGTFGITPGSVLELGADETAVLRIPEGAFDQGYNIVFKIEPKAKGNGAASGKIYRLIVQVPGSSDDVTATSTGTPFELALPLGTMKEGNLAIGVAKPDDKGKEKTTWTIIAPKRVDEATKRAVFELKELVSAHLHLTSKAPDK